MDDKARIPANCDRAGVLSKSALSDFDESQQSQDRYHNDKTSSLFVVSDRLRQSASDVNATIEPPLGTSTLH